MTTGGNLKKKVRERMMATGEKYTVARAALLAERGEQPGSKHAMKCANCETSIDGIEWIVRRRAFLRRIGKWEVFRRKHCETCAGELSDLHNRIDGGNTYEAVKA